VCLEVELTIEKEDTKVVLSISVFVSLDFFILVFCYTYLY